MILFIDGMGSVHPKMSDVFLFLCRSQHLEERGVGGGMHTGKPRDRGTFPQVVSKTWGAVGRNLTQDKVGTFSQGEVKLKPHLEGIADIC